MERERVSLHGTLEGDRPVVRAEGHAQENVPDFHKVAMELTKEAAWDAVGLPTYTGAARDSNGCGGSSGADERFR